MAESSGSKAAEGLEELERRKAEATSAWEAYKYNDNYVMAAECRGQIDAFTYAIKLIRRSSSNVVISHGGKNFDKQTKM